MKKLLFTFLFLSQSLLALSQFYNNFSDGNFTNSPSCNGDSLKFKIDSLDFLHHKTDASNGESILFNEIIGNSGSKSWVGVFSEDGTTERFKQVVVLSR